MRLNRPSIELTLVAVALLLSGALAVNSLILAAVAGLLLLISLGFTPPAERARGSAVAGIAGVLTFGLVVVMVLVS